MVVVIISSNHLQISSSVGAALPVSRTNYRRTHLLEMKH